MTDLKLPELPEAAFFVSVTNMGDGEPFAVSRDEAAAWAAGGCGDEVQAVYTAAQLQAYATAAVRAEREQAAVDALAKMIVRQEALTIKTVEGATHHMANWRRAREEARELLATLNRVADECENGGGNDAR